MAAGHGCAPRRVVGWGRSVLTSALVAGLAQEPGLAWVQVEATLPAALAELRRRPAHAVVCDLVSVSPACVLRLLDAHPQLSVVVVDPDADHALVLTCRRPRMRTVDDLVAVLRDDMGDDPIARGVEPIAYGPP